jgi:hypothetical protein
MPQTAERVSAKSARWWDAPSLQWASFLKFRKKQTEKPV